jgi:hypothetical protein
MGSIVCDIREATPHRGRSLRHMVRRAPARKAAVAIVIRA